MSEVGKRHENRQNVSYIPYDYKSLKLRIRAFRGDEDFARLAGMTPERLARILDEGGEFSQREMLRIAGALGLDGPEVTELFFTKRVKEGDSHKINTDKG